MTSLLGSTASADGAATVAGRAAGRTARPVVDLAGRLADRLHGAVVAPREVVEHLTVAVLCGGHVLLEDHPGVGKTLLAGQLAAAIGGSFARVQCTPDLMPLDMTGANVFLAHSERFEFRRGPVFANVVLVDELNRASPRAQAGLLQCMEEHAVTVDGITYPLATPFLVIATQNPPGSAGTFALPAAQLDRFFMRLSIGYPGRDAEVGLLDRPEASADCPLVPAVDAGELLAARDVVAAVHASEQLRGYIVDVLRLTRADERIVGGASPRAGVALLSAARARAAIAGRTYVLPDDVRAVAVAVLAHRLHVLPHHDVDAGALVAQAIEEVSAL